MKQVISTIVIATLFLVTSCQSGYKNRDERIVTKKIKIYFVNGLSRIISVKVPSYTTFSIYGTRGSYSLSYWTYCMGGMAKCTETIKNGVVDFEIIK